MNVLVIGGRLQGSEITYLAKEAGWHVTLVDRDETVLASGLCDSFVHADATTLGPNMLARFDLVIPATENLETLLGVQRTCEEAGVPFAFDETAFRVSVSKAATNTFLAQIGIPIPPSLRDERDWPFGYIVKPDSESGSHGVMRFDRREDAALFLFDHDRYVGQVFVEGPIYSIEVTCNGSDVRPHCVTEVVVGDDYDCYRIIAPAAIPAADMRWIQIIAHRIGLALSMRGIFDVELAWCDGQPYVLEIDARMPSQTPIAIYHATGLNLVVELARCFIELPELSDGKSTDDESFSGSAVLEHLCIDLPALQADPDSSACLGGETPDDIWNALANRDADSLVSQSLARYVGESELSDALPYYRQDGLLGADRALVAPSGGQHQIFATLIFAGGQNLPASH